MALATANDSEAAQAVTAAKLSAVGQAAETDAAHSLHAIVTPSSPGQSQRPVHPGFAAAMWRQKYEKQELPKRKKKRSRTEDDEEDAAPKLPKEWQPDAAASDQARHTLEQAAAAAASIEADRRRRALEQDDEEVMLVL